MAFKAFLGFARRFLRGGLRFFLLSQFALNVDNLPAVGVGFPIVLANLIAQYRASGFFDVLILIERENVLFHAGDFRTEHGKLALPRFGFPRQLKHSVVRRGYVVFKRLRLFIRLFTSSAQFFRALLLVGNGFAQTGQKLLCFLDAFLGAVTAQNERRTLQNAQLISQGQITPRRFARLFQRLKLGFQLGDDILNAGKVVAHVGKTLLALLLARAVFDNTRRFFKDTAPVLALLREDFVDASLTDNRIAVLADARIAEQLDDILQAAGGFVDIVFAFTRAVNAAGNHDLGIIHRQGVILVVKDEGYLAIAHALALLGAAENDVFHLSAAQCLRALFAQHPAHRIGQVGFAASVRSDNACDALVKDDHRAFRKRLEAVDFQFL